MDKLKREVLSNDMRSRLLTNRHGKLTVDQWKDMVMEPLVTLCVLMIPGVFILGPRLGAFLVGGFWIVGLLGLAILVGTLLLRAQRYARAPIQFATLYARDSFQPAWAFWRPQILYTDSEEAIRFHKRLAPYLRLQAGQSYLVYYLQEANTQVLLSLAPADHPDASLWQPSNAFEKRLAKRRQHR